MKAVPIRSLTVLVGVALLLSVALSCATSKAKADPSGKLRSGIGEIVADPTRAAKMLATVDEIEAAVGDLETLVAAERAALVPLLRDYGSPRASVEVSLAEFNGRRDALARRILTAHAALKADATAPEWKKLRKLEVDMLMVAAAKSVGKAPVEKES